MNIEKSTPITPNVHTQLVLCDFDKVIKDSVNPMFKKGIDKKPNYASLKAVHDAIIPELKRNGMYVSAYTPDERDDILVVKVMHAESMTFIHTNVKLLNMSDMQKYIASKTYARKALAELVGVPICEEGIDDDGNLASESNQVTSAFTRSAPINVTPEPKVIDKPKISAEKQIEYDNKLGVLTHELLELWKKKEGAVRADGSDKAKKAIAMFDNDLDGLPYATLSKLKDWILENNFVDVKIPQRLPTSETLVKYNLI